MHVGTPLGSPLGFDSDIERIKSVFNLGMHVGTHLGSLLGFNSDIERIKSVIKLGNVGLLVGERLGCIESNYDLSFGLRPARDETFSI